MNVDDKRAQWCKTCSRATEVVYERKKGGVIVAREYKCPTCQTYYPVDFTRKKKAK